MADLRRAAAWVPLSALLAITAGALALGVTENPPPRGPSVAAVLAATGTTRTAQFTARIVVGSPNPLLRFEEDSTGTVAFATGEKSVVQTNRSTEYHSANGGPPVPRNVTVVTLRRTVQGRQYVAVGGSLWGALPSSNNAAKGVVGMLGPEGLGLLNAPARDLRLVPLGKRDIDGRTLTGYAVQFVGRPPRCAGDIPITHHGGSARTTIWVDDQMRLREVEFHYSYVVPSSGSPRSATEWTGRLSVTGQLDISSYGRPLRVAPPPPNPGGTVVSVIEMSAGCR